MQPAMPSILYKCVSCIIVYQWVQWWICWWREVPGRQVLHSQSPVHCGHNPWERGQHVQHTLLWLIIHNTNLQLNIEMSFISTRTTHTSSWCILWANALKKIQSIIPDCECLQVNLYDALVNPTMETRFYNWEYGMICNHLYLNSHSYKYTIYLETVSTLRGIHTSKSTWNSILSCLLVNRIPPQRQEEEHGFSFVF